MEKAIKSPTAQVKSEKRDLTNNAGVQPPQPLSWASGFKRGEDGIYKTEMKDDAPLDTWVFSLLVVEAQTRDKNGQNWGLQLAVKSPDNHWHRWAMPMSMIGSNGSTYREILLGLGLRMAAGAQKHLHNYLMTARPHKMVYCVPTIGWHGNAYVLPEKTYGADGDSLILQTAMPDSLFRMRGDLEIWQKQIGRYCLGNSRLVFAACAAPAAVLLKISKMEGGGVHFLGSSSIGKSLLLLVAGSVAGGGGQSGFLRRWRTTDNAVEIIALNHNDCLLCLDEIAQVTPKAAAEISYMLSNGQGKARLSKDGLMRPQTEWTLLFLSNGELSLAEKLAEEGRRHMAGQSVRVLDIPADAGKGLGIFEELHSFPDGKAFAEHLQRAAECCYGYPLRAFIQAIVGDLATYRQEALALLTRFEESACQPHYDGQVRRAAKRFALFATAGELACKLNIFPWPEGTAFQAARRCFTDWITFRGGTEAAEKTEIIRRVRAFIATHRTSRFEPWQPDGQEVIHNSAGFRHEIDGQLLFLIQRDTFKNELCLGGNVKAIAQYLLEAGYLIPDRGGNLAKPHFPPRLKVTTRFYTIKGEILNFEG